MLRLRFRMLSICPVIVTLGVGACAEAGGDNTATARSTGRTDRTILRIADSSWSDEVLYRTLPAGETAPTGAKQFGAAHLRAPACHANTPNMQASSREMLTAVTSCQGARCGKPPAPRRYMTVPANEVLRVPPSLRPDRTRGPAGDSVKLCAPGQGRGGLEAAAVQERSLRAERTCIARSLSR